MNKKVKSVIDHGMGMPVPGLTVPVDYSVDKKCDDAPDLESAGLNSLEDWYSDNCVITSAHSYYEGRC